MDNDCDGETDEGLTYLDPVTSEAVAPGGDCNGYGACGPGTAECGAGGVVTCSTNPGGSAVDLTPLLQALALSVPLAGAGGLLVLPPIFVVPAEVIARPGFPFPPPDPDSAHALPPFRRNSIGRVGQESKDITL